ncbi:hypothetical protein D3C86_1367900 [compost metagenome]
MLFVSIVILPEAGTVIWYQTSPPEKLAQPGAGGFEFVADTFVPITGFVANNSPGVNTTAVAQLSLAGGGAGVPTQTVNDVVVVKA